MFGSACCLVMARIQFSLIKKNKDCTSRTLDNPHPPTSNNISFLLYTSHPTPQSERHMCIIPKDTHSLDVLYHQRCYNKFTLDYKAAISNQEAKDSVEKAAAEKRFLALLKTQMINQKSCFLLRGLLIEIKIMKIMVVK